MLQKRKYTKILSHTSISTKRLQSSDSTAQDECVDVMGACWKRWKESFVTLLGFTMLRDIKCENITANS